MTSTAKMGARRPEAATKGAPPGRNDAYSSPSTTAKPYEGNAEGHDPYAKDLLRRYLAEIDGFRELGNLALRDLEKRLDARTQEEEAAAAASEAADSAAPLAQIPARDDSQSESADVSSTLSNRLKELSEYLHEDLTRQQSAQQIPAPSRQEAPEQQPHVRQSMQQPVMWRGDAAEQDARAPHHQHEHKPLPNMPVLDRGWFEERFSAMRESIDQLADQIPTQRIEALETQFHQLMAKLDDRKTDRSIVAVEAGLKKLATYLEDNKQWSKGQDNRLRGVEERIDRLSGLVAQSHAALSETAKGLELVAKNAGPALAEKTADLVAGKLEPRLSNLEQRDDIGELGDQLSHMSAQSRQFAKSADERLRQLQNSLDESLDRIDQFEQTDDAPHTEQHRFGPEDGNTMDDDYDGKMIAAARRAARLADGPGRDYHNDGDPLRYQIPYGEFLPEEERANSRIGLVVAAVILLLASAAMLYLNLRGQYGDNQLSSASLSEDQTKNSERLSTGSIEQRPVKIEIIPPASGNDSASGRADDNSLLAAVAAKDDNGSISGQQDVQTVRSSAKSASLRSAAIAGDANAQFSVGEIYLNNGEFDHTATVDERLSKAARWFRRAAEKGHAPSQYRLATLYEIGKGAPKDHAKANAWYSRAAQAGHVKAMHNLAVLSVMSDSEPRDYAVAAKWFTMAAGHGLRDSQYNLGLLYERGLGVEKDPVRAYRWFALAAKQGDDKAVEKRRKLAAVLSNREIDIAKEATLNWTAAETDAETNRKAPEPPVRKAEALKKAVKPKKPQIQLMKSSWTAEIAAMDSIVIEAQKMLAKLGYQPGPIDGIFGPKTAAAIRAFQQRQGVSPTGKVTRALVDKMSIAL